MPEVAPGPWLRLTALAASAATLLAVVSGALELGTAHRALSALALPPLLALLVAAVTAHRRLVLPAVWALVLFGVAALVTAPGIHLAAAALAFAAALVATAGTFRGEPVPIASTQSGSGFLGRRWWREAGGHSVGHTGPESIPPPAAPGDAGGRLRRPRGGTGQGSGAWRDYVALTKPRIMALLLWTGACGMFVGARGVPPLWLFAATMLGLALACGGASALNHVLDRDIDRLMGGRTRNRPVAAERVAPARALEFGLALSAFSFVLLAGAVNVLTAALALVGNLFYVLVYTRWLKRSTPQNIVIGGAAGAVPPLVGWAAATGNITLPALFLFAIVFFWTPPHFWALALLIKRDYAAARIPMLPVVRGDRETARQILLYSLALVPITLLPFAWHTLGVLYLAAALVLGTWFALLAWRLRRETTPRRAAFLFHFSLLYLALLFVAMAVDPLVA